MRSERTHHARTLAAFGALLALAACATTAPRPTPAPARDLVRHFVLDYVHVPQSPADADAEARAAWTALRAGDAAAGRAALDAIVVPTPHSDTAEGFLLLAGDAIAEARTRFQRALGNTPGYAPALYGLGFAAEAEGDRIAGIDWYRQAVEADPTLSPAAVRLQVLQLESAQAAIAAGERAEVAGDPVAARDAYETALELAPEVLEPYLRLAAIARDDGDAEAAVSVLRTARDHLGERRLILVPLGEALDASGAYAEAYDVFQALQAIAPDDPEVAAQVAAARERYFTTSLPEAYRELESKDEIYREDLAALLAIRLEELADLVAEPRTGVIMVDIEDSWARDYIREVVSWGVMQVFQNHAFGPELVVKRQYFAEVVYRVLRLLDLAEEAPRARLSDVATEHYFYDEIRAVVGLGILETDERDAFGLLEPVSGREAVAAVQRVVRLARSRTSS